VRKRRSGSLLALLSGQLRVLKRLPIDVAVAASVATTVAARNARRRTTSGVRGAVAVATL